MLSIHGEEIQTDGLLRDGEDIQIDGLLRDGEKHHRAGCLEFVLIGCLEFLYFPSGNVLPQYTLWN